MKEHIGFNRGSGVSIRGGMCAFFLATTALGWSQSANAGATFKTIDVLGAAYTDAYGINGSGVIVGYYDDQADYEHSFVRAPDGTIKTFDPEGSIGSVAESIDDSGSITGVYFVDNRYRGHGFVRAPEGTIETFDPEGSIDTEVSSINKGSITGTYRDTANAYHGFVRAPDGTITTFDVPGATETDAYGINRSGWIAGSYNAGGYLRDPNGTFTTFDVPGSDGTEALRINSVGSVAGIYYGKVGDHLHGFVRTADGGFTTFPVPKDRCGLIVSGINRKGVIAGSSLSNGYLHCYDYLPHSFVRATNGTLTAFDPPGSVNSAATGINDDGDIVGYYRDNAGQHGYLRTP